MNRRGRRERREERGQRSRRAVGRLCVLCVLCVLCGSHALAQNAPPAVVAGIPVNYDEAQVGTFTLPDPLVLANGQRVTDAKTWMTKRRPEVLRMFETIQFGRAPETFAKVRTHVFDAGTPALDGKATRKQIDLYLTGDTLGPRVALLVYLPAQARGPVPLLLHIAFSANASTVDDPGVRADSVWTRDGTRAPAPNGGLGRLNPVPFLEKGIGVATLYYGDIEPDFIAGVSLGIRAKFLKPGQTAPAADAWGAIAAWSWGLSRVLDYLETERGVNAKRVALVGVSRLGKTVLYTAARDQRFAAVIASCSGESGAAISRRNYGETVAHMTHPTRYAYQFAAKYGTYGSHVNDLPMDGHMLVALVAPRPVLLQTGTTDGWSDPRGEFLSAVAAGPVFKLLGTGGFAADSMPPAGTLVPGTLAYYEHEGGHGTIQSDWPVFLDFLTTHLVR